jgi:hypothetical protein
MLSRPGADESATPPELHDLESGNLGRREPHAPGCGPHIMRGPPVRAVVLALTVGRQIDSFRAIGAGLSQQFIIDSVNRTAQPMSARD